MTEEGFKLQGHISKRYCQTPCSRLHLKNTRHGLYLKPPFTCNTRSSHQKLASPEAERSQWFFDIQSTKRRDFGAAFFLFSWGSSAQQPWCLGLRNSLLRRGLSCALLVSAYQMTLTPTPSAVTAKGSRYLQIFSERQSAHWWRPVWRQKSRAEALVSLRIF